MERLTGKQAQSLMEAVASVYEKKEDCVDKKEKGAHNCAKKVCHEEYGEGECIFGQHAVPDENGFVSHYDVQFEHGIVENVSVEDLEILISENHPTAEGHRYEGEDLQEVDLGKLYKDVVNRVTGGGRPAGNTGVGVPRTPTPAPTTSGTKPSEPASSGGKAMQPAKNEKAMQPAKNEGEKPMGQHPGKSPDKATRDKYETQRRRNEAPTGVGVPDKSVGYGQLQQSVDLFDIVKGHLIDEGLTEEEALKKMLTLTDEERSEIIEGSCGSKKDKKKKGGYGK